MHDFIEGVADEMRTHIDLAEYYLKERIVSEDTLLFFQNYPAETWSARVSHPFE